MDDDFRRAALDYHRLPRPGKLAVEPTKRMATQRDLGLAYSPGVAAACEAIAADPATAYDYTTRGNMVGVITNGTAVLGLGAIGALASKPVMEGKAVLFKKFAGIDSIDIEVEERDPAKFIEVVAALEPSFGAINLEDIKAPECFVIERTLRERMKIPVFHDDQHGTAIIVAAAVRNGLLVQGKRIEDVKLVNTGGGAAALACLDLLVSMGLKRENVTVCDIGGVVHTGRNDLDPYKARYARQTEARTLEDALPGADVFLGLSAPRVLKPEWLKLLGPKPLVLALANPEPEILPEAVRAARPDAIVATGRTDYPNQVNNVLCFPFIFRGALDVGATEINEEMKLACVRAIAALARADMSDVVASAYGGKTVGFGPDYIIPAPFDPRLITEVAPAVAEAAMRSGVAARPIADLDAYRHSLERFVYTSGTVMQPVFTAAATGPTQRIAYAEGDDDRVLRAAQIAVDERLARPVFIGRPDTIRAKIAALGLRLQADRDYDIVSFDDNEMLARASEQYFALRKRHGVTRDYAAAEMRRNATLIGAMLVRDGQADGMLCGVTGAFDTHLRYVREVIGLRGGVDDFAAMHLLMLPRNTVFICDTYVHYDPTAEELAKMAALAAETVRDFGFDPRIAVLSHSSFGSADTPSARKMRAALELIRANSPDLEVEGEMHADAALSPRLLERTMPDSALSGEANLLLMPNVDAANITFNALKIVAGEGVSVGPILLGATRAVHILTPSSTVRRLVNMTALAAVDAVRRREG